MPGRTKSHGEADPSTNQPAFRIDRSRRSILVSGRSLRLTRGEFRLLDYLLNHPGETISRSGLAWVLTEGKAIVTERTVDVHICAIRRKLHPLTLIETVRGVGYRFHGPDRGSTLPSSSGSTGPIDGQSLSSRRCRRRSNS